MSHRLRVSLIVALWLAALVAPLLTLASALDPLFAVDLAHGLATVAVWTAVAVCAGCVTLWLLWPPFYPGARLWLRRTLHRAGIDQTPLREALARLEHLETAQGHVDVARMAYHLGQFQRALPHAVRAVELDPDLTSARYLLVRVLDAVGQHREAIRQCRIVLRDEPDHAFGQAIGQLGLMLHRAGEFDAAIETLEEHARNHGPTRTASFALGEAYRARKRNSDDAAAAVKWFREAARAPIAGEHLPAEDALVRARARVRLWGVGGAS